MWWLARLSRPRFWFYLAGPFLVSVAVVSRDITPFVSLEFWLWLFFLLIPANIILYGVNDLADWDTDHLNEKKNNYEQVLESKNKQKLKVWVVGFSLLGLLLASMSGLKIILMYLIWLGLSLGYSLPPTRFKARPFIDFVSNGLYIVPAVLGFYLFGGENINNVAILAAWAWAGGMHLYSAIPDIAPDRQAGLKTTAVALGESKSAWLVMLLFAISGFLASLMIHWAVLGVGGLYGALVWRASAIGYAKIYKVFPIVNAVLGFLLFWWYFWPISMLVLKT